MVKIFQSSKSGEIEIENEINFALKYHYFKKRLLFPFKILKQSSRPVADVQMWQKPKWAGWRQPIAVRIEIFLSHDIYYDILWYIS